MKPHDDVFDSEGLERVLARAERSRETSEELDFLADLVGAAELERARLARPVPIGRRPTAVRPWMVAAAASLLCALALGAWWMRADRAPARLASGGPPRYIASELRAPDEPLALEFARAMEPYARGEWQAGVVALEGFLAREPEHGPARFYLAAACEQLGELARAEREYEHASRASDALLADHARLRLAELHLARGEVERARAELEALASGAGELARSARARLDELARR